MTSWCFCHQHWQCDLRGDDGMWQGSAVSLLNLPQVPTLNVFVNF